jgi:uncharacterized protein (DUF1501 family)
MRISRRGFLGAGLAGIGALTLPRAAAAAGNHNLIIVFARGGWDPVWSIDPKDSLDIDSPPGTVKNFLNNKISILTAPERPNIEAFFAAHAAQCAVVRGIDVGSIAHFSCHVRMMTGARTELFPDVGMITAVSNGGDLPLPYADIGGGAYAGPHAAKMGRLGNRNQVVTLLDREKAYAPAASLDYADAPLLVPTAGEQAQVQAWLDARAGRLAQGRGALGDNARRLADYRDSFGRADDLRAIPELKQLPNGGAVSLAGQIELAMTMLAGTSRAVYLDSKLDWDTHDNIADQGENQDALFGDLALLVQRLGETGLAANTTVVVMSEMGRTPRLNSPAPNAGKDHWPTTSALVLGAGVRPGTYGGTDLKLNARKVDLVTGAAKDDGVSLRYDNFAAGVLTLVGVDPQEWLPNVAPLQGFIA